MGIWIEKGQDGEIWTARQNRQCVEKGEPHLLKDRRKQLSQKRTSWRQEEGEREIKQCRRVKEKEGKFEGGCGQLRECSDIYNSALWKNFSKKEEEGRVSNRKNKRGSNGRRTAKRKRRVKQM